MIAAGRIRFCLLILLIVVLNVFAATGKVLKRDGNTNGNNSVVIDESSLPRSTSAESDYTTGTVLSLSSSVTFPSDSSTEAVTFPEKEELSHGEGDVSGKWCLHLITEADRTDSESARNESNLHTSGNLPKPQQFPFILDAESKCGTFYPSNHDTSDFNILYVTASWPSESETHLCVEFGRDYATHVQNLTISGEGFRTVVAGRPGESEVIPKLKHCCACKYQVTIRCRTGGTVEKVIREEFPIKMEHITRDMIHWSYPMEGLPCMNGFRVDLSASMGKHSDFVSSAEDIFGHFKLQVQDVRMMCSSKNVTITPIFEDFTEGKSVTEYSEVILSIDPVLSKSATLNYFIFDLNSTEVLDICVREINVFDETYRESVEKPSNGSAFPSRAVLEDLDVCRLYTLTFEVIDIEGRSRFQVERNASIMDVVGTSMVELQLYEKTPQFGSIQWNPRKAIAHCIGSYVVERRDYEKSKKNNAPSQIRVQQKWFNNTATIFPLNASDICSLISISVTPIATSGVPWTPSLLEVAFRHSVRNAQIHPLSSSSINVTWDLPTYSHCVSYYSIYEPGLARDWHKNTSSIVIDNLSPCVNYTFSITPVDRNGVEHLPTLVLMPEQHIPQVERVWFHGDKIKWSLPSKNIQCIKDFQVLLDDKLVANVPISIDSVPSRDLSSTLRKTPGTPCALHKYSIIPVSLSGQLGSPYQIAAPRPRPGPVRNVTIDTSVERELTISWMPPELFPECVSSYRISFDDQNITNLSNETSVTIQNLNSCMEYNFTIATVEFSGADAASVDVNATVKEEKLSEVQDLELTEQDPRSLIARWKPPVNGSYCVASYRYVAWATGEGYLPEETSNSTTDLQVTFPEVFACTKYNVQVIPVSKQNNDGLNEIAEIVTKERVILRYHIDSIRIRNQMARSLELQTALTGDNNNNCQLTAVRFSCSTNNVPEGEDPREVRGEAEISEQNATFSAVVSPLEPYNEYNCTAAILNLAGWSDATAVASFMTGEDFPEQPQNLQLRGDARMIELTWKAPKVKNGIITRYRVHIRSEGVRYPTPSYCPLPDPYNATTDLHEDDDNVRLMSWNDDELDYKIHDLNPYTDYVVQVAAATKAGLGPYTEMVSVATLPEQSEPVYEFSEFNVTQPEIDKQYNSSVHISWTIPCHLYGRLQSFKGQFIGTKGAFEHTFGWSRIIDPSEDIMEKYTLTEERLEPELQYNVSIMIFVEDIANHSDVKFLGFQSPAGIPNITHEINWGTVNVMDAPNPTRTARIRLSDIIFQSNVGNITSVALLVSERHCQEDPVPTRNISTDWPDVLSWRVANQKPCIPQYQTTPRQWNPLEGRKFLGRQTSELEYIIGKDHCDGEQEFCNGVLKPGTEYALIVRVFTNTGYSDSAIQVFRTDSLIQLTVIVTSIFVCLLLAFALGLAILWRTQKLTVAPVTTVRSPNEEPADIPLKSFSGIYEELIQSNREKINKEYQAINFFSEQLISEKVTFFVAKENEKKNRYLGIFPYDGNRVPLDLDDLFVEEDEESNDYINASFIDGYKYQREYIATQGPKKETCFDFWRMILQYEVESIVMLTQTVENDRIKCYQYFPRFTQTLRFRDVSVKCTQELNLGFYQKRLFLVTKDNINKAVFHYHFLTWPDHGCPSSASDLIKFIKIIRSERKNLALPVVVHCSAGVGRTGTLIALDIILQRIQQEKKINIYDTVKQLRKQRVKMVQTSEQYAFLYHACLEYTTRNNRKKPKTSTEEITTSARSSPDNPSSMGPKNGRRPMINIKFPKYVHSGISNVKSYVPDDVESKT